jgi:hypothetical protein
VQFTIHEPEHASLFYNNPLGLSSTINTLMSVLSAEEWVQRAVASTDSKVVLAISG